jgi:type IV secretion system protein VirB6
MAGVATSIEAGVQEIVDTFATTTSASLAGALTPVALGGITIYLIIIGYAIARGEVTNSLPTIVWKCVRMTIICTIALGGGAYQQYVVDAANGIEGIFNQALGGQQSIGATIDASMVPLYTLTDKLYVQANATLIPNGALLIAAVLCTFGQALVTLASLVPLLVAKVTLALLLAIGPVFVMLALWPATQRFTEAWVTAIVTAILTNVIVAAVVVFLPTFIGHYAQQVLNDIGTTNVLQGSIGLVIATLVLAWIAWRAADLAAQLAGGASLGNPVGAIAHEVLRRAFEPGTSPEPSRPRENSISPGPGYTPIAHRHVLSHLK